METLITLPFSTVLIKSHLIIPRQGMETLEYHADW